MKTTQILLALAAAAAMSGCYKEDMSDCVDPRGNVRLTLSLDNNVDSRGGLADFEIDNSRVYVFGKNNNYITFVDGGACTDGEHEIFMTLAEGEYNFVVWTNEGEIYHVPETESRNINEMELHLNKAGNTFTKPIPDLLHGSALSRTIIDRRDNNIVMVMTPNSYIVNVVAQGLSVGEDIFETSITNNISKYNFQNTAFESDNDHQHVRQQTVTDTDGDGSGRTTSLIRILNLSNNTSQRLTFRNVSTGNTLFDESLVQTIIDAYSANGQTVDFTKTHKFDITLTFNESANMGVSISVNGWEHTDENADLQ